MSDYLHEAPTQRTDQRPEAEDDGLDRSRAELSQLSFIHHKGGHSAAGGRLLHAAAQFRKVAATVARQALIGQLQFAQLLLQLQHLICEGEVSD